MKRVFTLIVTVLITACAFSQAPQRLSYQSVVRNASGVLMANQAVGMKISILQGSETGTAVYVETQTKTTNANGLVTLEIGSGTIVSGTFSGIDWSNGTYFIKTETDPTGGTSYSITGTSKILSVPYALYSKMAKSADYNDLTNKPTTLSGYGITDAVTISGNQTISGTTTFKGTTPDMEESLFEVKNKDGQTIFAVYNEGVRIWVADGAKGSKGGFAVGGFDMTKGNQREYFVVTDDSIRIYIDSNPATKGTRGGFAVGGYDLAKGPVKDYLTIDPDSTNIYVRKIDEDTVSTFSIIGIDQEGDRQYLLIADPDTLSLAGVLQIQYNIIVTTAEVNSITLTSAISGGNIVSDGDAAITARGVCWSTDPDPTIDDSKTDDGASIGTFSSNITGLTPGTTYHIRAYATNLQGTAYGADVSFTTSTAPVVPTVTTEVIYSINITTALSGGNITSNGGAAITARGVCWSTTPNPTISNSKTNDGTGSGSFPSSVTGLTPETTYHLRAYATNSAGTAYGADVQFTTTVCMLVFTVHVSAITTSTAASGGNITSNCGAAITARGICWSKTANPTISDSYTTEGSGTGSFASNLTGLSTGTIYFVRAYATTDLGTYYGNQFNFITLSTIADIDGNVYSVIRIGNQYWMRENLKTVNLNDGTPIMHVTDSSLWNLYLTPEYCYYNNDKATYNGTYGALYNWYAVQSGKLCPAGWHVPTHNEWITLISYLGGGDVAGWKLKEAGTTHWISPNVATNESGFTALPGGLCYNPGGYRVFQNIGLLGYWWSADQNFGSLYYDLTLYNYNTSGPIGTQYITDGLSVRCIKD